MKIKAFEDPSIPEGHAFILYSTLDQWCHETMTPVTHVDTNKAAVKLVEWYNFGFRRQQQLLEMIRPIRKRRAKLSYDPTNC